MIISENCGLSASGWLCKKKASSCMHCSKNSRHLILIDPIFMHLPEEDISFFKKAKLHFYKFH